MIYLFFKKISVATTAAATACFISAASISDFHTEAVLPEPSTVRAFIVAGAVFLVPLVVYGLLELGLRRIKRGR